MRNQRVIIAVIVGLLVVYLAADFIMGRAYRQPEVNAARIIAASQAYARDLRARGQTPPPSVGLQDLVNLKYIPAAEVKALEGVEVRVSLQVNLDDPGDMLLWAKLPDGEEFVVFANGNVQTVDQQKK